jgi:hypothetical protein
MRNPRQVDETEFLVQRLRRSRTPEHHQRSIRRALTFPTGDEPLESKIDLTRVYNESCFEVDDFVRNYEERWGFKWLPEKPKVNENRMAGLREHYAWWGLVETAVRDDLPCRFDPKKVQLTIEVFQKARELIETYPKYDQELLAKAVERWNSEDPPDLLYLVLRTHNPVAVDRHYRALDRSYADAIERLAVDVTQLYMRIDWIFDEIVPTWNGVEEVWGDLKPIGLYDVVTGRNIRHAVAMLLDAASEINRGEMGEPRHRDETLKSWDKLIALFAGFREKISRARSNEAKVSDETTSPQTQTTNGQPREKKPSGQGQAGGTPAKGGKEKTSVGGRFIFNPGQAMFDERDLGLPTGLPIEVLKRLVSSFGTVVPYGALDGISEKTAEDNLRNAKHIIQESFKEHHVPCEIVTKTREGYLIREKDAHPTA